MGPAATLPMPPEPGNSRVGRRFRRGRRPAAHLDVWSWMRRAAVGLMASSLGLAGYVYWFGLPGWALAFALDRLAAQGRYMEVEALHIDLREGFTATGVRYYDSALRIIPVIEADEVTLRFRPEEWLHRRAGVRSVALSGATLRLGDHAILHRTPPERIVVFENVSGDFAIHAEEILVSRLRAQVFGLQLLGEGCLVRPSDTGGAGHREKAKSPLGAASRPGRALRTRLIQELKKITFVNSPVLELRFVILPDDPTDSTIRVQGAGSGTDVRGVRFDRWALEAAYEDRQVQVNRCEMVSGARRISATGHADLKQDRAQGRIESTLPPTHWLSLMPQAWRDHLSEMGIFVQGSAAVRLDVGPSPISALWRSIRGDAAIEGAEAGGVWVDRGNLAFDVEGQQVRLYDVDLDLGKAGQEGTVQGECRILLPDRSFAGRFDAEADVSALLPLMNENQAQWVHRFQFGERHPIARAEFSGRPGLPEALFVRGDAEAWNFSYRGAYFSFGRTGLLTSNRVTRLDGMHLEREDGEVDGSLRIDFRERTVEFEVDSGIDPKALAQASSDTLQRILEVFSFEGPVSLQSTGRIDLDDRKDSFAEAHVEAVGIGLKSFVADQAEFDVDWQGERAAVKNIEAELYGGRITGTYDVFAEPGGKRPRYRIESGAAGVDFQHVVRTLFHKEGEPYRGRIEGNLTLTGIMGEGQAALARGEGWVRIQDGRITQIPLFGGLSRLLSRIFPGLGFSTQSEFQCRFSIDGWDLSLTDIKIQGNVFSLSGDGTYHLQSRVLDFDVEFRLLRDGVVGNVVQWVTSPITSLIKFDLEGTWDQPRWRPKNLPKELFEGFGG